MYHFLGKHDKYVGGGLLWKNGTYFFLWTLEEDITFPIPIKVYEFHNDVFIF